MPKNYKNAKINSKFQQGGCAKTGNVCLKTFPRRHGRLSAQAHGVCLPILLCNPVRLRAGKTPKEFAYGAFRPDHF
jgi:hypothetical protein